MILSAGPAPTSLGIGWGLKCCEPTTYIHKRFSDLKKNGNEFFF